VNGFCFRVKHHHSNHASLKKPLSNYYGNIPYIILLNFPQLRCGGRALRAVKQVEREKLESE